MSSVMIDESESIIGGNVLFESMTHGWHKSSKYYKEIIIVALKPFYVDVEFVKQASL